MGLEINKANVLGQLAHMNQNLSNSAINVSMLKKAIGGYMVTYTLKAQSYDALRNYFSSYHIPVLNGMLCYLDEMLAANRDYESKMSSDLTKSNHYDEDKLEQMLQQTRTSIQKAEEVEKNTTAIAGATAAGVSAYLKLMEKLLQDQLNELRAFEGNSTGLYSSAESLLASINAGISCMKSITVGSDGSVAIPAVFNHDWRTKLEQAWSDKQNSGMKVLQIIEGIAYTNGLNKTSLFSKDPVNLSTGNFIYEKEDLTVPGTIPLTVKRFYNALDKKRSVLGTGWTHNYEERLMVQEESVVFVREDGKEERYMKVTGDLFISGHTGTGAIHVLKTENGIQYYYREKNGDIYRFNADGQAVYYGDDNGNGLSFSYHHDGSLKSVHSAAGALYYHYDGNGFLSRVADHTGREVCYSYEGVKMEAAHLPEGQVLQYSYHESGWLETITNPRGTVSVKNFFDEQGRVTCQRFPDGGKMSYHYDDDKRKVTITEQNGHQIAYYYDEQYRTIMTEDENGQESYAYNDQNLKTLEVDRLGNQTRYEYDSKGNLIQLTDALGVISEYEYTEDDRICCVKINGSVKESRTYDDKGNLLEIKDALGRATAFTYHSAGLPETLTQADGSQGRFQYDNRGNIIEMQDVTGQITKYCYDQLNRVIKTTDGNGKSTYYRYDDNHNLTEVVNAEGAKRTYTYNRNGQLVFVTDFDGTVSCQEYGVLNKPSKRVDPLGNATEYEYDLMWNLEREIDAAGGETRYEYDSHNRLTAVTAPNGGTTRFAYDQLGNRTKITGPEGETYQIAYDALNRVTKMTDPCGDITSYAYNSEGFLAEMTDANGGKTTYEYDAAGQLLCETNPLGESIRYTYTALGQTETVTDAAGRVTRHVYGKGGVLLKTIQPDGKFEAYEYDGNQNLVMRENEKGYCQYYRYDSLNRITEIESNQGEKKSYTYDAVGNVTGMTDANGNQTRYEYDAAGHLTAVTDALGNRTAYTYDVVGNLIGIEQADSGNGGADADLDAAEKHNLQTAAVQRTLYQRDLSGQVTEITDALGNREEFQYNLAGQVTAQIDKDGFETRFGYTKSGELNYIHYADGREVRYQYDALKKLKEMEDWLGITRMENDALGRPVKITDHQGRAVSYEWNTGGTQKSLTYPDGKKLQYEYDEYQRIIGLNDGTTSVNYAYDQIGRLSEKQYGNGTRTAYTYNTAGQLAELSHLDSAGVLDRYRYGYDAAGNRSRIEKERRGLSAESGVYHYDYDPLNRLQGVVKDGQQLRSYRYDAFGNRTEMQESNRTVQYAYNSMNQLTARVDNHNEERYNYDKRGNLTEVWNNGVLSKQYGFGALNRLEKAVNHLTGEAAQYRYNGLGFRTGKVEGTLVEPQLPTAQLEQLAISPTKQIDDVLDLTKIYHNVLERHEDGNTTAYTWDTELLSLSAAGRARYAMPDELGSPIRFMDEDGTQLEHYGYDEFGQDLYGSQGTAQPFGYTGYQYDSVTGTYFAQAREYAPAHGGFVSKDPLPGMIKTPISLNAYIYCNQDSLNKTDRSGMWFGIDDAIAAGVGAITGVVGQAVSDVVSNVAENGLDVSKWKASSWETYVGSAVGGAAGGVATLYVGPAGGAAISSATSTITTGVLENVTGTKKRSAGEILVDAGLNAGLGFVVGKASEKAGKFIKDKAGDFFKETGEAIAERMPDWMKKIGQYSGEYSDWKRYLNTRGYAWPISGTDFMKGFLSSTLTGIPKKVKSYFEGKVKSWLKTTVKKPLLENCLI